MGNLSWLAQAIARLHNFAINERLLAAGKIGGAVEDVIAKDTGTAALDGTGSRGLSHISTIPHDKNGDPAEIDPRHTGPGVFCGHSASREKMVQRAKTKQSTRLAANRIKRRKVANQR